MVNQISSSTPELPVVIPQLPQTLLTSEEVAKVLNVSVSFAYQLMRTGTIPTVRIGKAARVRPEDLDEFIRDSITPRRV